jgi:hypothetical protein
LNLKVGEDFTYIVRYAFLNLGEVRIKIVDEDSIDGKKLLKTVAYIDSYDGLPFVNLHQVYESFIYSDYFPYKFIGLIYEDDTTFTEYIFSDQYSASVKKGNLNSNELWADSIVTLSGKFQDGLSILFYTRMNFGEEKYQEIPCFVNEKKEVAKINYFAESEPIEIDAVDYRIDCRKLEGETDFVSVYGLTGEFEGWFSYDESSVPIVANMNVLIGSISLELINWNKDQWNPPQYKN